MALRQYKVAVEVGYSNFKPYPISSVRLMPWEKALNFHLFPMRFELYRETLNFIETASVQEKNPTCPKHFQFQGLRETHLINSDNATLNSGIQKGSVTIQEKQ
jgi:hypothetical protein